MLKGLIKKPFIYAIAALVVIGVAIVFLSGTGKPVNDAGNIKTAKATKGELRIEIVSAGVVSPDVEVIVKSKAGGEITEFPFNEGDLVNKGQTIVKLDPKTERARANQAEANLLMAKARLDKARISLKDVSVKLGRQQKLYQEGIISRQELDDAEVSIEKARTDLALSEAELLQSREALKEANERLSDTEIKAPFAGTILRKFVDRGQVISSTLSSASEGTQIFSIADLEKIRVVAEVDEVDIARIVPGQEASIKIDSMPEKAFAGKIERIAPKGKVARTVTVFEVVVAITDKDKALLKPGMTADVKVLTKVVTGALLVPKEAVKTRDGGTGVYVMENGTPRWTPVKAAETNGVHTAISEGIGDGAEVVTSSINANGETAKKKKRFFF
ncbi:MAG: efflux RND transporter periplasmic adaptor subunit [Deltaproteobacteria bacterium]|nr:efflux RND transporter periplasmic adaptor subunit [Deltaproteobacteria bacterium]